MRIVDFLKISARKLLSSNYGWTGDFSSWEAAQSQCTGYDNAAILHKVKQAVLQVKVGKAVYERDSVLFDRVEYSWPLLSALMWVANLKKCRLRVLDFGGSLGSSYFQNQYFLHELSALQWNVVEQESFVKVGRESIQDDTLRFYTTVSEAIAQGGQPDILLIACTLPYLQDPYFVLRELMQQKIPYLIIDNTFFNYENRDRICKQTVPPQIYEASYPCWFLDYDHVKQTVREFYTIISEHTNDFYGFIDGRKIPYKGFLAKIN